MILAVPLKEQWDNQALPEIQALVDQVRLERARDLLASTTMNLSQIADSLGYADAANFTRAFKRWTGLSPSHFRNRELQTAETA